MRRRHVLGALGTAVAGGIAGCTGGGDEPAATETATDTATATETATATATATETATETATATPEPSTVTESVGQAFTVGEGSAAVGITVRQLYRAQALGPTQNEEASETYLVIVMTVENPQSDTTSVPSDRMKLRGEGVIKNVDFTASEAAGSDSRLDVPAVASASIPAGESVTGAVVFDGPTGVDLRVELSPPPEADGRVHVVPVGDLADLDPIPGGGY